MFNGAETYLGFRNAFYLLRSMRSALQYSEMGIAYRVHAAYSDILRHKKLPDVSREHAGQLTEQLRRVEGRHKAGKVTKLDVHQARIYPQNQNLLILKYQNQHINAIKELGLSRQYGMSRPRLPPGGRVEEINRK